MNVGIALFIAGIIGMSVSFVLIIWSYFSKNVYSNKISKQPKIKVKKGTKKEKIVKNEVKETNERSKANTMIIPSSDDTMILNNDNIGTLGESDTIILDNNSDDTELI